MPRPALELGQRARGWLGPREGLPRRAARRLWRTAILLRDSIPFRLAAVERRELASERESAAIVAERYARSLSEPSAGDHTEDPPTVADGLEPVRELLADATADEGSLVRAFREACSEPLRVGFVLHGMGAGAAGGVHSIYQETRAMRGLGIDARIVLPAADLPNARRQYADADELFTGFGDEGELARGVADRDVVVATHFGTVELVRGLRERREDFVPAYYVQDYEPFFFDERSAEARAALASYDALAAGILFAKTAWLCDLIGRLHGVHVIKVEPSLDHELYRGRPRSHTHDAVVRVLGMVRPRTTRRQPLGTLRLLDRIQTELAPDVETRAFGCERGELRRFAPQHGRRVENLGSLTRANVARVLAGADVFLDFSSYQAFGRTALEAMACGCVPVVPRLGGPSEYAVHGENALVVDTTSEDAATAAVADLVADRERLGRMQAQAIATARRFSATRAAVSEYVAFSEERARRRGGPARSGL